jgi:tripartite-type tricarboxylate transporter receptor subunit TctC
MRRAYWRSPAGRAPGLLGLATLAVLLLSAAACAPAPAAKPSGATPPPPAAKPASSAPTTAPAPETASSATSAPAPDERALANFYRGKTMRIIVGTSAGGGYDTYSRAIGRHLGKYIPGSPTIIVENMPGAGSMIASNHLYNVAPKDGTVIGNIYGELVLNQVFGGSNVQYDMGRYEYLGVPVAESYIMIVHRRAGIRSFDELLGPNSKQLVVGSIANSTVENAPLILRDGFGANIQIVSGYQGTSNIRQAIDSGEVDGFFNSWQSVKITNRAEIESGDWVVLAQLGDQPLADLPQSAPTIRDIAKTDEQRDLLLYGTYYPNTFAKAYVLPPGVPADRVAMLQSAFLRTLEDPEFLADVERTRLEIAPVDGQRTRQLVLETLNLPANIKSRLQPLIKVS